MLPTKTYGDSASKNIVEMSLRTWWNATNKDYATGIPIDVFFNSLLIPSISTKTIQLAPKTAKDFINTSRFVPNTDYQTARLMILVGKIAVVNLVQFVPSAAPQINESIDYLIDLPASTRLPVSRDDIILDAETSLIFRQSIDMIFNTKKSSIFAFQTLLESYKTYTANDQNRRIVDEALNAYSQRNRGLLVKKEYYDIYHNLSPEFILATGQSSSDIEEWLDDNIASDDAIWHGMKVIMGGPQQSDISSGGLTRYLFISDKYAKKLGSNWISTITSSYFDMKLLPIDTKHGDEVYAKYERYIDPGLVVSPEDKRKFCSVYQKLDAGFVYYNLIAREDFLRTLGHSLSVLYQDFRSRPEAFYSICDRIIARLSTFKGNQTYGGEKYSFTIIKAYWEDHITLKKDYGPDYEKRYRFLIEHVHACIDSTQEGDSKRFYIRSDMEPSVLLDFLTRSYLDRGGGPVIKVLKDEIIRQSSDLMTLTGLVSCFIPYETAAILSNITNTSFIPSLVGNLLPYTRSSIGNTLALLYEYTSHNITLPGTLTLEKARLYTREFITIFSKSLTSMPVSLPANFPNPYEFKLSTLISYLFKNNYTGNLDALFDKVSKSRDITPSKLQITEIAVNEGTTKPFLEAALTETVQNSIDAVRQNPDVRTEINIDYNRTKDGKHLQLSITDYVGMPDQAFLYIAIPFLSTKTPSEIVTGEMGSGFFNVYRESDLVVISTVYEGKKKLSHDVPIRDSTGRVIDIHKEISLNTDTINERGTTISMFIPVKDDNHYAQMVSTIEYFSRHVLALSNGNLFLGGASISIPKVLVYWEGPIEVYLNRRSGAEYDYEQSYLLTKGIPFAPLGPYIDKERGAFASPFAWYQRNVFVNITHSGYTPLQSRTRIRMDPAIEKQFRHAMLFCIYISQLFAYSTLRKSDLDHYNSKASVDQLRFTTYKFTDDWLQTVDANNICKYYPQKGISLAELLNECMTILGTDRLNSVTDKKIDALLDRHASGYTFADNLLTKVVVGWLQNKNQILPPPPAPEPKPEPKPKTSPEKPRGRTVSPPKKAVAVEDLEEDLEEEDLEEKIRPSSEQLQNIMQKWLKTFWSIAADLKIKGYDKAAPQLEVEVADDKNKSVGGFYTKNGHKIVIPEKDWWTAPLINEVLAAIKQRNAETIADTLRDNRIWQTYFSYTFPAAALPHEIEHARRGDTHMEGVHSGLTQSLWVGDDAAERTYDQVTNGVFHKVLSNGFYERLYKEM